MSGPGSTVAVIGLGAMGSAMAGHLVDAGFSVLGVDPDEDRCREMVRRGVSIVASGDIRGADVIVTSLPSFAVAREVLDRDSALGRNLTRDIVIIETSTLSLAEKEALRDEVGAAGGTLLDCPMSGTAHQARAGDLVAYLSGDDAGAKARAEVVLAAFCRSVRDLGTFGSGTLTKLIANHLVAVHNVAAAEALALADAAGLDLAVTLAAVLDGAGSSRMLEVRGPLMIAEDYLPAGMRVDLFRKDLGLISALAEESGVTSSLLRVAAEVYARAAEEGRSAEDTACAFSVLRTPGAPAGPAAVGP